MGKPKGFSRYLTLKASAWVRGPMCNAWNHQPGCACGFGEPSSGMAQITGRSEWPEDVQEMPVLLKRGLRELGWTSNEIAEFMDSADVGEPEDQGLAARIRKVLARYRIEEVDHRTATIEVPLFRFSAPNVHGAEIAYYESEGTSNNFHLNIRVFGVGTGTSTTLEVERTATYLAAAGNCKVVTIPIKMRLAHVKTFHGQKYIGDGVRAEVIVPKAGPRQLFRRRGCKSLQDETCREPGSDPVVDQIAHYLAGDVSGAIHEVEQRWTVNYANEISLTFSELVDIGPLVRSARRSEVTLVFRLPAGNDYQANVYRDRLWWEAPQN